MPETVRTSIGARRNPETEAAVLKATAAIIREEGFAKLTIEAVARRARAGKATIYRWWPSRGHLLLALYSSEKMTLPMPDTGTLKGDLDVMMTNLVRQWAGGGERLPLGQVFRLLVAEAQMDDTIRLALHEERDTRWRHLDDIVERARTRGELNPAITAERAEQRIISLFWYLLLNDELPTPEQTPALVRDLMVELAP
jgi:AcrR family transcriptional regulator